MECSLPDEKAEEVKDSTAVNSKIPVRVRPVTWWGGVLGGARSPWDRRRKKGACWQVPKALWVLVRTLAQGHLLDECESYVGSIEWTWHTKFGGYKYKQGFYLKNRERP